MRPRILLLVLAGTVTAAASAAEIHVAARDGDVATVTRLLAEDPSLATVRCDMGKTPLHWATGWGQMDVMRLLLDRFHVDVDIRNKDDGTPLHVAASQGRPEGARLLLAHGARVDARRKGGATPLHIAAMKHAKPEHYEVAAILIDMKADVNARMDNGATPLQLAITRGNERTARLIERHGGRMGAVMQQNGSFLEQRRALLLRRFDANGNGFLDPDEREAMRAAFRSRTASW